MTATATQVSAPIVWGDLLGEIFIPKRNVKFSLNPGMLIKVRFKKGNGFGERTIEIIGEAQTRGCPQYKVNLNPRLK